ncbi:acyltransferase [Marichromatium sp. AB32]|nr:acyltransferase [Marichromatium sp. AB32]
MFLMEKEKRPSKGSGCHPAYRPDIDGLRAVAVLFVVLFHAFPSHLRGGFVGVDVFFVISGFLISSIIFKSVDAGAFSLSDFYGRRVKRIFPALFLVLLSSYLFGWYFLLENEYEQLGKHIASGAAFISNIVLFTESGYFDSAAELKPLLHLWSLGVEEQFYIFWPLLVMLAWRKGLSLAWLIAGVFVVSFSLGIVTTKNNEEAAFYLPLTRFWELLAGSLLAWLKLYAEPVGSAVETGKGKAFLNKANVFSLVGVLFLIVAVTQINERSEFPGYWALFPVLGAVLIIAAGPQAWVNEKVLSSRLFVWVGLISYPLYLWHWPILSFGYILEDGSPAVATRLLGVAGAFLLAWLTYQFVEKRVRSRVGGKKILVLVFAMSGIGLVGLATYLGNGFGFRLNSNLAMDEQAIKQEREQYWSEISGSGFRDDATNILIFGDSQAFDIYKALANDDRFGLKIYQTSFECAAFMMPKWGAEKNAESCRQNFATMISSPEIKDAEIFVYAAHWQMAGEPEDAEAFYRQAVAEIKALNPEIKVVFFGPKPLIGETWLSINAITKGQRSLPLMNASLNEKRWLRPEETDYARSMAGRLGVDFIDTEEVFCAGGCPFYENNKFSYFDQLHWTEFGASLFMTKLKARGEFQSLVQ